MRDEDMLGDDVRQLASRYDEDRATNRLINVDVDGRSRLHNIGLEDTFGHAQDDVPFDEIAAVCGPFNCSQVILAENHEALGISLVEAERVGNVLGGGMWHGGTCGCLMSAILAAGYLDCPEMQPDLVARFADETGAISCPSIVHSPTSCATCIALGRELVANVIAVAAARDLPSAKQVEQEQAKTPRVQPEYAVSRYTGEERTVILPEGVTEILPHAFKGLPSLRIVMLPASMRVIGERAFADCGDLRLVVFQEGLRAIGEHAFAGCGMLTAVDLPKTVTSIGKGAFAGCPETMKGNLADFDYEDGER